MCLPGRLEYYPYYLVRVKDAQAAMVHLQSFQFECKLGVFPLHMLPELRPRWQEEPEYPVAEKLHGEVLALSTSPAALGHEDDIMERLFEVT